MLTGPAVHLFGAVSIDVGGRLRSAGGPRQAGVLAVLALSVGRPVSVQGLIAAVWGEDPPNSVGNVLQVHVSALRKVLRPIGFDITRIGAAYSLAASLDDVDVECFHRDASEGRAALRAMAPERALASLQRAWETWDPTPFSGLDECAFVAGARASLLTSGLSVATERGAALSALGRHDEAVSAAESLVDGHPFFEPGWELLMRALYLSGRQHDALLAFSRARSTFVEELGLDPPVALVDLERKILDRSLDPVHVAQVSPSTELAPASGGRRLPEPPSAIIGRAEEVDRTIKLVEQHARLVTLVGLGGIGKTTAALTAGHRLAAMGRTVVFADLAAATDATAALETMCEAVSVAAGADAATSLADADPGIVVIADNAEQINDFSATVARLLAATSRLQLIVTSRRALQIRAEHVIRIQPLQLIAATGHGDAALLFIERARQARDDVDLTGHDAAIAEICEIAGGIPLAIEVAARRLGHFGLRATLDRLRRHSTALLEGDAAQDQPMRQHSLRAVLDATAATLSEPAIRLAQRICVLKGPVTMVLLEHLVSDDPDLLERLDELGHSSLVNGPDAADRYRMPTPICEYFANDHRALGEEQDRVLHGVLALAEPLESKVDEQGRWAQASLLDDAAAVSVACETAVVRGDWRAGARLAFALRRYWLLAGRLGEALQFCRVVLDLAPTGRERAHLLLVSGHFAAMLNRPDGADVLRYGIDTAEATSDVDAHLLANSWCYLGSWLCDHGDADGARRAAARVAEMAVASDDESLAELGRDFGAYVAARLGELETAVRLGSEALEHARARGDLYVVVDLLYRLAENLLELGRVDEADLLIDEAMAIAKVTPVGPVAAKVIQVRAAVDIERGRLSSAIGAALEALRLTTTLYPDPVTQASVLQILGAAFGDAGDIAVAARCDAAATVILRQAGAKGGVTRQIDVRLEAVRLAAIALPDADGRGPDPDVVIGELLQRSAL